MRTCDFVARSVKLIFAAILFFVAQTNPAKADLILDFRGGIPRSPFGDAIGGWEFRVISTITVNGIGFWDEGGDGLVGNHTIGLWDGSGSLIASTVVTNSSAPVVSISPDGRWLFNDITPLVLGPGRYAMGATYVDLDRDQARLQATASTLPAIAFVQARQRAFTSTLTFPDEPIPFDNDGVFGPNLRLVQSAPIPEPTALTLLFAGLVGANALRLRRRFRAARHL